MTACGFVALIGAPNAGKSTLLNKLVGAKVSIVSRKAQTTRGPVRGVVVEGDAQIVFVDTPGLFPPKRRLDRAMSEAAWSAAADADALALLVDVRAEIAAGEITEGVQTILDGIRPRKVRRVLILNKIDLVEAPQLLALSARLNAALAFDETFMISAESGAGVDRLKRDLARMMPEGPWLYPEDELSDATDRMIAAELTREQIVNQLYEELPYASAVETETWEDRPDGSIGRVGVSPRRRGQRLRRGIGRPSPSPPCGRSIDGCGYMVRPARCCRWWAQRALPRKIRPSVAA